jgi:hypothetical protein
MKKLICRTLAQLKPDATVSEENAKSKLPSAPAVRLIVPPAVLPVMS